MEYILDDFPEQKLYVMSDVDAYYEKQNHKREGSIFEVKKERQRKISGGDN